MHCSDDRFEVQEIRGTSSLQERNSRAEVQYLIPASVLAVVPPYLCVVPRCVRFSPLLLAVCWIRKDGSHFERQELSNSAMPSFVTRDFGPHFGNYARVIELVRSDLAHFACPRLVLPASCPVVSHQGWDLKQL